MDTGVSNSRFNMWRAVFAMAHADQVVTGEERAFMERYLSSVPFSDDQKTLLRQDMDEAQDVYEAFSQIHDAEDKGLFFQFARELCWCDGDFDAQEEEIKERLKAGHFDEINLQRLELELRKSRAELKMKRTADDRDFHAKAGGVLGLVAFLKGMMHRGERR